MMLGNFRFVPVLITILSTTNALEWSTSSGQFCLARCMAGPRDGEKKVYWCPTTNGTVTTSMSLRSDEPGDYCTPSEKRDLPGAEPEPEPETEPEPENQGDSGFNHGSSNSMSSLAGYPCTGPCELEDDFDASHVDLLRRKREANSTSQGPARYECPIQGHESKDKFYCSLDTPKLFREQISARKSLWCISACTEHSGVWKCRTMLGEDNCSKSRDFSSNGKKCTTACKKENDTTYMCQVDGGPAVEQTEMCGFFGNQDKSAGGQERGIKRELEYTMSDEICAGPCNDNGTAFECMTVSWKKETQGFKLRHSLKACSGVSHATITGTFILAVYFVVFS